MDWNDVRYFLALARLGSIRAAGASLGVSHSTVSRRIETLEEQLSARLFDRSRDGYTLTDAGQQMLAGATRIEQEMAALERGVVGQDERLAGSVALTCCDTFVSELLIRALKDFCRDYPGIELAFNTDSRPFDLSKREADIAVRILAIGGQPPECLIGQKLVPITIANYVARAHLPRLDPGRGGSEARWLTSDERSIHQRLIAESSYPQPPPWGTFSSLELLVQAAREGLGLVMLPTYVGDSDAALQRLEHPDLRHVADMWLLCHPDLRDNARVRATRRRVADALERLEPLFCGTGWSTSAPG
ncbi:LysR family transcriptional regulator [Enhygromyxa salina]|uniref:HTH-type transcriptional regulator CynR n=1 Tax=Enhygromyxa salina TaxID=215803 RepID=A0A2S9YWF1_9BACT|nr:LysR family transcriptional regulator [Enhygromyxa salina]PRQ09417.1 HTH-type transcriptional regulator CynR [Enhygromyxa salina]